MTSQDARPTSIRIFLTDGLPDGIRIISKSNWTGQAVVAGRSQLGEALQREELNRPGVYTLLGPGNAGASQIYIGEADILRERIKQHATRKDFWTQFVAFSSTDGNLNKAHVRYLEYRLIALAKQANQWEVGNNAIPAEPPLSEPDRADAEWYLREMLIIYPILGVDAFEAATQDQGIIDTSQDLSLCERGADGWGRELKDGFVVLKGSKARIKETNSIHANMQELRRQLLDREVMISDGNHYIFTQDFRFSSPSLAAGVLVGGASNGRRAWKTRDGRTLREIQDARAGGEP
jgi:hypothetical protein